MLVGLWLEVLLCSLDEHNDIRKCADGILAGHGRGQIHKHTHKPLVTNFISPEHEVAEPYIVIQSDLASRNSGSSKGLS